MSAMIAQRTMSYRRGLAQLLCAIDKSGLRRDQHPADPLANAVDVLQPPILIRWYGDGLLPRSVLKARHHKHNLLQPATT